MAKPATLTIRSFPSLIVEEFCFSGPVAPSRSGCFSLYLLLAGEGVMRLDRVAHELAGPVLVALNPYQRVAFRFSDPARGRVLQFHPNFFCIETQHHAVGCNGILFNDIYEAPLVNLSREEAADFGRILTGMEREIHDGAMAHLEVLSSLLRIFLIRATRCKMEAREETLTAPTTGLRLLRRLREEIETHYRELHRPSDYARLLGVSRRALAEAVRDHLHMTVSQLIRDRVIQHAKWQLLHTLRPVKEIAFELGFEDEFYFSRLFKRAVGLAPLVFRTRETEIRGGANLSM